MERHLRYVSKCKEQVKNSEHMVKGKGLSGREKLFPLHLFVLFDSVPRYVLHVNKQGIIVKEENIMEQ